MSPLRVVALVAAIVAGLGTATPLVQAAGRAPITVGSLTLEPCETSALAWCATVQVPFSYADPQAGTTGLYFEWFPATENAQGTVLAVEGGPGYSSTSSRDYYLDMLGPLTRTRNVLIADLRGTGRSDPVRCPRLQNATTADGNQAYIDAVGACGRRLNHTRQRPDGSYVRGSDLYTTANAARDIARLLDLLAPGRVDLYGDSYGTYFAQVFTSTGATSSRSSA
ncbi:alpha/beta fold hydrolase [Acrocarpospora sp. B8E8]|uniref:alpha/beta fold hydrolase n=1 Tax=Acrocarpospora sp. B8E8 TaxID=3153572 RepID=UPI00325E5642